MRLSYQFLSLDLHPNIAVPGIDRKEMAQFHFDTATDPDDDLLHALWIELGEIDISATAFKPVQAAN